MGERDYIVQEIKALPEPLLDEVIDFIEFIKSKNKTEKLETLGLAESALKKDWLSPEEDLAWQYL
ncbi:MAG: DUF2281 domain-containing protein [Leptospirales bacterium]